MHLDPLNLQVLPRLSHTGSAEHVEGVLELASIEVGVRHFALDQGIAYDIDLTNTGEAILLSGRTTAALSTNCDRCLDPAILNISGEVQGYYLFDASTADDGESLEVYEEVDRDGQIDIAPPLLASIVVELPTVALCKPDCAGIPEVPVSTAETSAEDSSEEHPYNPDSPFAALDNFQFEDELGE